MDLGFSAPNAFATQIGRVVFRKESQVKIPEVILRGQNKKLKTEKGPERVFIRK